MDMNSMDGALLDRFLKASTHWHICSGIQSSEEQYHDADPQNNDVSGGNACSTSEREKESTRELQ